MFFWHPMDGVRSRQYVSQRIRTHRAVCWCSTDSVMYMSAMTRVVSLFQDSVIPDSFPVHHYNGLKQSNHNEKVRHTHAYFNSTYCPCWHESPGGSVLSCMITGMWSLRATPSYSPHHYDRSDKPSKSFLWVSTAFETGQSILKPQKSETVSLD